DDEDAAGVRGGVPAALVVLAALLGDGEVETDRRVPGEEFGGVLLADGEARRVGAGGEQPGEGGVVGRGEPAGGALEGVEVVRLDRLEATGRAVVDPAADDLRELGAPGGRGGVEQGLVPLLVHDGPAVLTAEQQSGMPLAPPAQF